MRSKTSAVAAIALLAAVATAHALDRPGPLVQTEWLAEHAGDEKLVILDVRADPKSFTAVESKPDSETAGHVQGARLWPWKEVRVNRKVDDVEVLGELPTRDQFEKLVRKLGVNNDSLVVITSDASDTPSLLFATRAYFQFRYFGFDNVAILDGGTAKWKSESRALSPGQPVVAAGNFIARAERKELLASMSDVETARKSGTAQLVDARTSDFYLGQALKKGEVTAKGHIPGSKNLPHTEYVDDKTHAFKGGKDLRQLAEQFGVDSTKPAIAYCNTGHLASGAWFVMHELVGDKNTRLYDGSMNEWTARGQPVSKKWE